MTARKKEIEQIDLDTLNFEQPAGKIEILELKPAVETREPKEVNGTPDEIANEIVRILKEEAKVINER